MDMDAKEYLKPLLAGEQSADEIDYIDEVCGILDNDHDLFSFPSAVDVHFLNIQEGTFFNKVQSRVHNIARMRVENGIVNMVAISLSPITNIQVSVFREPKAAELHGDRQGKVQLPVNIQDPRMDPKGIGRHYFSVDLDDVYEGPLAPVYALAKNDTKKRNLFQLGCIVYFVDGSKSKEFFSKPFLLKTKERPPKRKTETTDDDVLEPTPSRPRQDSDGSGGDSGISQWSPGDSSGSTSPLGCQAGQEIVVKNLRVVDHLEASRAKIDYLTFSKMKPQGNADLGYHIQLGDPEVCGQYREGDVVAFCEGENGQTEIELLTNKNINSAFLAGVISRSAYLEAKPRGLENAKTDVVCVIGVVKVNCMGKVQAGERVYATVDKTNPGVAIPESSLPLSVFHGKENGMLGMALETKNSAGYDEMQLVRCFVCIVLGVQNKQLTMEIENMYDEFEMELMIKLRKERKKTNKIVCGVAFALLMLLGLVGVLLYQLLYPGTAMRYWLCKQGCIPDSTAQFTFIPYRDITQRYHVRGVQFKFEDLLSKLPRNEHVYPVTNKTGGPFRYYLNIDRCAYGGNRLSGTILADQKQVGGAKIFAVNFKCTKAYYFQNPPHGGWKMYQSVEKYFKQSLKCYP